jgi:myo-inositol 2-dehydrogenase/D-chiro-inositol 1-dehydrogenase
VRTGAEPVSSGEDGRIVLEMLYAAYHSARIGRKVPLPFHRRVSKPIDLWLSGAADEPASV